ncbi:hypothetical protein BHE74_00033891 [Ensete ventricosum]|nr:hypothetical protein GW17_00028130 [Ensete ventricosum]RWW59193.1 hypothetical protein BHE74_00033891 [Ensete ventricosum]RZS11091.1 hypothetical protein BHM03_00042381 [Ensete ventricosum]
MTTLLPLFPPTNTSPSSTPCLSKRRHLTLLPLPPTLNPIMAKLVSLAEPVGFLFLQTLLSYWYYDTLLSPLRYPYPSSALATSYCTCLSMAHGEPPARNTRSQSRGDAQLDREDVEMVMDVMDLPCSVKVSSDELSSLFEEEPRLEEVKETFRVFPPER